MAEGAAPLEDRLRALGHRLEVPPTPPLAASVGEQIRRARAQRLPVPRPVLLPRKRLVALVALGLLLLGGAAVAARLAIGALSVDVVTTPPTGLPTARETGPALGEQTTLAGAQAAAGFRPLLPQGIGAPDRVYVDEFFGGTRIVLAWEASPGLPRIQGTPWGLIAFEFLGEEELAAKEVLPGQLRRVTVDGRPGLWLHGGHRLTLRTSAGPRELLVTGNVLVWQQGLVTVRLETDLPLPGALALAGSVR